ncbi:hypothetical protein ILYODFUR_011539 [Ilyodon furcidens]|uniref:Transposase n=1 Tax=Ilyodon furcidens TaxID=33524 RepID=A0ABV0SKD7_9TELE
MEVATELSVTESHQHVAAERLEESQKDKEVDIREHTTRHRHYHLPWAREHLCRMRDQWNSVLFSDESRFTLSRNGVGDIKESSMHQPIFITRRAFGGGVTVWAAVSSQYRTTLHFVNGTVISPYYLNNIINPVIVALHKQHRPSFMFTVQLIKVASLGNDCCRLGYLKWSGLHFLQT